MKVYFEKKNYRLICIEKSASVDFWEDLWKSSDLKKAITSSPNSFATKITKKYLPKNSKVLDAGCGVGNQVYSLQLNQFTAVGIDFAPKIVKSIQKLMPDLNIDVGDVRSLPYKKSSFDGIWSLGVIEHNWDGYDQILREAHRVLRSGGYFFIAFPSFSPLRKLKVIFKMYPLWKLENSTKNFYQFLLDPKEVIGKLKELNFEIVNKRSLDGIKGCKDEIKFGRNILSRIYKRDNVFLKAFAFFLDHLLKPFSNHSTLIIAEKK